MLASSLGSAAEMVRPGTCQDAGQKYVFKKKKVHRGSGGLALLCGKYYITYPTFRKEIIFKVPPGGGWLVPRSLLSKFAAPFKLCLILLCRPRSLYSKITPSSSLLSENQ